MEEIDFVRLGKLRLEVQEPEDISSYGALFEYDRSYDRVTVKVPQNLSSIDRIRYNLPPPKTLSSRRFRPARMPRSS